uniref:3-oxo-5-alpha-steroid 4-dehydrogenase C-terminal domain-containing protein n=1 Tax=Timspurckia oligopyrenoides TaxID=708627 RepID=A0A7S0ZDF3_9RHOD|mmetsp:Transcript_13329/g.23933  ORF Transcript_13329/g.23933 Transcript_13329/m.23933 type:complete len:272 (+) Transcript_13329:52-867(+)
MIIQNPAGDCVQLYSDITYRIALVIWFLSALISFFTLAFLKTAPYGRHFNTHSNLLSNYTMRTDLAWILQESPNLIIPPMYLYFHSHCFHFTSSSGLLFSLFFIHYFQRTLMYPLLMKSPFKPTPVFICILCLIWCTINAFLITKGITFTDSKPRDPIRVSFGILLWTIGFYINMQSDHILRKLRVTDTKNEYLIPHGFLFEFVSCPNYLGEIIEWIGFAIAAQNVYAAWIFAFWTIANLAPRAIHHHKWYLLHFTEYKSLHRTALLPFVL